jgi:hypothetical protein
MRWPERAPRRWAARLLAGAGAAYALLLLALGWGQERLIFHPEPLPAAHDFGLPADIHEVFVQVPGARLNALHLSLPRPRGLVFFLHGNGGNLESWFVNADFYRALNLDLYMLDYRGYGKSSGHIGSEAELLADARAAWQSVAHQYAGLPVVFMGRSLGTGVAARLAADLPQAQRPRLLVLVSPYRSLQALARENYPWVPDTLLRYPLRTDLALQALAPGGRPRVLLVHGERDRLIPMQHSAALAALAPGATLRRIPGAGHGDLQDFDAYLQALREALRAATD